jgi:hypothetical protein
VIDGRSATPWCPTLPRLANARYFARADALHPSLSFQTNKQLPIAAALQPDEGEEPERGEKHNLVETKKKKTVSRNLTTQNNRKLGFWIHRKKKRYGSRCGKLLAKRKKDNDIGQWRGSWGPLGRWRNKSKEQKQQRFSATTQKAEEEKKKAKAKGSMKKSLFSSLEFTPPTLFSSHPRASFLPHSKKTNKKGKKKTQHNTEKTDFSKRKRVFSLDRLTQYQNIK